MNNSNNKQYKGNIIIDFVRDGRGTSTYLSIIHSIVNQLPNLRQQIEFEVGYMI